MMGSNASGQLGIGGNKEQASAPCLVESLKEQTVLKVQCGSEYTMAIVSPSIFEES